ncbi:MAG: hypothetical protein AB1657_05915 [Candidatus Micrarchaeota archaeon]
MEKEEGRNNSNVKAAIATVLIAFFSVAIFIFADMLMPFRGLEDKKEFMQSGFFLVTAMSSIMLVLAVYLVYTYVKDYVELKSGFTLGVLSAVVAFMLFAITSNPLLQHFLGVYGKGGLFQMIPLFFAMVSLAILAWVSSK